MNTVVDQIEGAEAPAIAPAGVEAERRKLARRSYAGFGLGIVLGFAFTAYQVKHDGYQHLLFLVWNLIWLPGLGLIIARRLGRPRRIGPRKWRLPQFQLRTLMVIVAYVALIFGAGVWSVPLGSLSAQYLQKAVSAEEMAKVFRGQIPKFETEASLRRGSVEELRAGEDSRGTDADTKGLPPLPRQRPQGHPPVP